MRDVKQCYGCKQKFRVEELISYASINSKTYHNYCSKCLKEKQDRERFSDKVCSIFGIKAPGPQIWTERKRLIDKYGYTDDIIIDSLDYIYKVKHKKILSDSLYLITPALVDEMHSYRRREGAKSMRFAAATNIVTNEYIAPIQENNVKNKNIYDPDAWLEDGDDN